MDDCYGVMAVEELLAVVGFPQDIRDVTRPPELDSASGTYLMALSAIV